MRKLTKATKIHPSPPPSATTHHHLSLLPLAISTLAAALPPHDQQVLAYLLTISSTTAAGKPKSTTGGSRTTTAAAGADHPPEFTCNCFRCYTSFWARWDSSPNRKVIHEIIDAYEDQLMVHNKKGSKNKKDRKNNKCYFSSSASDKEIVSADLHAPPSAAEGLGHEQMRVDQKKVESEGAARKIVNFIGERIWGVWGV